MSTAAKSGHTVAAKPILTVGLRSLLRAGRIISPETFSNGGQSVSDLFTMPILGTKDTVTWRPTAEDRETALQNHYQTLERLKERGGLAWEELDAVLAGENRHHHKRELQSSKARVHRILVQRNEQ